MTGFLKLISAILWALNYVRQNPKKSAGMAGVGALGLYAAGVPQGPFFYPSGTPTEDYVVTADANGQPVWAENAGGGGGGITYDGTIGDGQIPVYDDTDNVYIPTLAGGPVYNVKNYIGGIRAAGSSLQTTGTVTAASTSMTVAAGWDGAEGHEIAIVGAGSDHGLSTPAAPNVTNQGTAGATSYDYRIAALSGDGGWTACGTITTTTTGNATLSTTNFNLVAWPAITGGNGYVIYGGSTTDASQYALTAVHGQPTALGIVFDAGGYTNAVTADIGRTVVQGGNSGVLVGFDNTARLWIVDPVLWGDDTFGGTSVAVTITAGTGAGTQTSPAANYCYWKDCGAAATTTPFKYLGRRNSTEAYVGELMLQPVSSSGVFYRCVRVRSTRLTDSSAPSFDTDIGDDTVDGNVVWRRENQAFPPTPPAAAVFNVHRCAIAGVSGTTVTLSAAATTSVTSQYVFHDDWSAIKAWLTLALDSGRDSVTVQFPPGDYEIVSGTPVDDGAGVDSRWSVEANGANDFLFSVFKLAKTGAGIRKLNIDARGSYLRMSALDSSAKLLDDSADASIADNRRMFDVESVDLTMLGCAYVYAPLGEPVMEHSDAWNWMMFAGTDDSIVGPAFYGLEILGFPRTTLFQGSRGLGHGEIWKDCYVTYGGSDHDAMFYTKGGLFENCYGLGVRFTRSTGFYQDAAVNTAEPLRIVGGGYKRLEKDGIRIRANDAFIGGGVVIDDCSEIGTDSSSTTQRVTINGARIILTNIDLQASDDVQLSNLNLQDSEIYVVAGMDNIQISNVRSSTPSAGTSLPTGTTYGLLSISGGTNIQVSNSRFEALHTGSPDVRALSITGGSDEITLSNSTFQGSQDWGVYCATFTGRFNTSQCVFGGDAGAESQRFNFGSAATWKSVNDTFLDTADVGNETTINGGGRVQFINPTFRCRVAVYSTMTGPVSFQGGNTESTATIAEPGTRIEDFNFGTAPNLSGANVATDNNRVADVAFLSPAALALGSVDNYALGATDVHRLDPNAGNSTLTGIVARAGGTVVTIINVDAGSATITLDEGATSSTDANEFDFDGSDLVIPDKGVVELIYDGTSAKWRLKSKNFTSIFNRDAQRAFDGLLVAAA